MLPAFNYFCTLPISKNGKKIGYKKYRGYTPGAIVNTCRAWQG